MRAAIGIIAFMSVIIIGAIILINDQIQKRNKKPNDSGAIKK
ncbi:MAG TPA: hypothetical protein PLR88_00865 [Bacteroidales bacterium]|nr:hypothetical protein [Bacteroidales bacterium]